MNSATCSPETLHTKYLFPHDSISATCFWMARIRVGFYAVEKLQERRKDGRKLPIPLVRRNSVEPLPTRRMFAHYLQPASFLDLRRGVLI